MTDKNETAPTLREVLREAFDLMPVGTAKRAAWLDRAAAALAADSARSGIHPPIEPAGLEQAPDSAATIAALRAQVQDLAETIAVLLPDRAIDALIAKAAANPELSADFRTELKALLAKPVKRTRRRRSVKR